MKRAPLWEELLRRITKHHVIVCLVVIMAVLVTLIFLWPKSPGLQISALTVWRAENGLWYTTLLLTNELDVDLTYEWLDSEDREVGNKRADRLLFYDYNLGAPSGIGPHQSVTYPARLPLPGTARRFRLRYRPLSEKESRLKLLIHRYRGSASKSAGRVAVSHEISADAAIKRPPDVR